jgi:hypothetical protein
MTPSTLEFSGPIEVVRQAVLANPGVTEFDLWAKLPEAIPNGDIRFYDPGRPNAHGYLYQILQALKKTKMARNEYVERDGNRERVWFPPKGAASSPKRHTPISGKPTIKPPQHVKHRDGAQVKRRAVKPRKPKQSPVSAPAPSEQREGFIWVNGYTRKQTMKDGTVREVKVTGYWRRKAAPKTEPMKRAA